jgi:Na+/H+-translocating membrane pyrophosphatase
MPEQKRTTIIVSIIAATVVMSLISTITNTGKSSKTKAVKSVATVSCGSAAGNITDGRTLYSDAACTQPLGTVTGVGTTPGGQKTVFVANPTGNVEQISRDIVKTWYTK